MSGERSPLFELLVEREKRRLPLRFLQVATLSLIACAVFIADTGPMPILPLFLGGYFLLLLHAVQDYRNTRRLLSSGLLHEYYLSGVGVEQIAYDLASFFRWGRKVEWGIFFSSIVVAAVLYKEGFYVFLLACFVLFMLLQSWLTTEDAVTRRLPLAADTVLRQVTNIPRRDEEPFSRFWLFRASVFVSIWCLAVLEFISIEEALFIAVIAAVSFVIIHVRRRRSPRLVSLGTDWEQFVARLDLALTGHGDSS